MGTHKYLTNLCR